MLPPESMQRVLTAGLQNGGDLAEVYLENSEAIHLSLDDSCLEKATQGNDIGGGVRVFYGNTAAYAYTDDLSEAALTAAAKAAAKAARGTNDLRIAVDLTRTDSALDFPIERPFSAMSLADKAALLHQMDAAARATSPSVVQVRVSYYQTRRRVWIYNATGLWVEDDRQMLEFWADITAQRGDVRQTIWGGLGGQVGLELLDHQDPVDTVKELAETAVRMLAAQPAPAGEMPVVINHGWGGVLFHEACGHCMEADYINRGTSPFAGLVGQRVGPAFLTAIDDGTLPGRRGSFRFDDEATPSQRTVLIEQGILKEYMLIS